MSFSPNNMKKKREEKKLTQMQLAGKMSGIVEKPVQVSQVNEWEKGRYSPHATYLSAMAEVFGCSIDDLFADTTDQPNGRTTKRKAGV